MDQYWFEFDRRKIERQTQEEKREKQEFEEWLRRRKPLHVVGRDPEQVVAFLTGLLAKKQWIYHVLYDVHMIGMIHDYLPKRIPQFSLILQSYYWSDQNIPSTLKLAKTLMPRLDWIYFYNPNYLLLRNENLLNDIVKHDHIEVEGIKMKAMATTQENYQSLYGQSNIGIIFDHMESGWNPCYATSHMNPSFVHLFVCFMFQPDFGEYQYHIRQNWNSNPNLTLITNKNTKEQFVLHDM